MADTNKLICSFWENRHVPSHRKDLCRECGKEVAISHQAEAVYRGMGVPPVPLCIPCGATNHPDAIIRNLPGMLEDLVPQARQIDGLPMSLAALFMIPPGKEKSR